MGIDELSFPPTLIALFILTFGLIFGSFSSVLALRIPAGKSIVTPPSSCPKCDRILAPWENFPLISYLALRGRCRGCYQPIGRIYPLMEFGTASLYVAGVYSGGITPLGLAYSGFAVITLPLVLIDLGYKRLPNVLTYSGFIWGLFAAILSAFLSSDLSEVSEPLITSLGCAIFFLLLNLISRGGMGMGDVKLAGVIGITLALAGWHHAIFGILLGFLVGGLFSLALLLSKRAAIGTAIPFGPWMLLGAWIAIILGPESAVNVLQLWSIT